MLISKGTDNLNGVYVFLFGWAIVSHELVSWFLWKLVCVNVVMDSVAAGVEGWPGMGVFWCISGGQRDTCVSDPRCQVGGRVPG